MADRDLVDAALPVETDRQSAECIVALHIDDWGWGPIAETEGLAEHELAVKACIAGIRYGRSTPTHRPAGREGE